MDEHQIICAALNLAVGLLIWATSPLSLVTSLMCAVPGGTNDTPIVAAAMGANAPDVTIMQLIRQVLGIGVFPIMIEALDRLRARQGHPDPGDARPVEDAKRMKSKQKSAVSTVAALAVAFDKDAGVLLIGGKAVKAFRESDASVLPWRELGDRSWARTPRASGKALGLRHQGPSHEGQPHHLVCRRLIRQRNEHSVIALAVPV